MFKEQWTGTSELQKIKLTKKEQRKEKSFLPTHYIRAVYSLEERIEIQLTMLKS